MKPAKHLINEDGSHSVNCFPCRIASVTIAPSAMGTRFPEAERAKAGDPQLEKDRDAYKRLRRDGTQPKHVQGSSHFEKHANEQIEVEMGVIIEDAADRRQTAELIAQMPAPSSAPIVRDPDNPPAQPLPTGVPTRV
jgi:hypothetical protein